MINALDRVVSGRMLILIVQNVHYTIIVHYSNTVLIVH